MKLLSDKTGMALLTVGFSIFLIWITFDWGEFQQETLVLVGSWFSIMLGHYFTRSDKKEDGQE